jgi:hypothetical protein
LPARIAKVVLLDVVPSSGSAPCQPASCSHPPQIASRGDTQAAVTLLTKYVSLYVNDLEAWEELAAMYLQVVPQNNNDITCRTKRLPQGCRCSGPEARSGVGGAVQASQYQQAAFCLEEALLREPGRIGLHLLYADTLYCIGGPVRARHTVLSLRHGSARRLCQGSCQRLTQLLTRSPSRV